MKPPRSIADLLTEAEFFADLPQEVLDLVGGCGRNVHLRAGELLCRAGGEANTFYLIRRGRVAIELALASGQPATVSTVTDGGVVGWSWLFPPYRWQLDARATTDIRAVAFDGVCLREKCDADPAVGYQLMGRFAQLAIEHLQAARLQMLDVYGTSGGR